MSTASLSLGQIIRQRRLELGWTQEQLAERISADGEYVRQSEISRIESGRIGLPRRERLERIACVLDVPLGELLVRSGWTGADRHLPSNTSPTPNPSDERDIVLDARGVSQARGELGRLKLNPKATDAVLHGDERVAPVPASDTFQTANGSIRVRREELSDALIRLGTEKERLLRNRRTVQELQEQFARRSASQDPGQS